MLPHPRGVPASEAPLEEAVRSHPSEYRTRGPEGRFRRAEHRRTGDDSKTSDPPSSKSSNAWGSEGHEVKDRFVAPPGRAKSRVAFDDPRIGANLGRTHLYRRGR